MADDARPAAGNIATTIFREVRRRILSGELSPGERLPGERELAAEYRTNRNTLREAVRRLEQARLVTVRHGQGVLNIVPLAHVMEELDAGVREHVAELRAASGG